MTKAVTAVTDGTGSEWSRIKAADQQRRARDRMLAQQRVVDVDLAATPETVRKLHASVIARLVKGNHLGGEQLLAAKEIDRVYQAICCALFSKTSRFGRLSGAPSDWKAGLTTAYVDRYGPWRDRAGGIEIRHGYSLQALVIEAVVENRGMEQIGLRIGADRRTVLRHLQRGLYLYAEMAGWTQQRDLPGVRVAEFTPAAEKAA